MKFTCTKEHLIKSLKSVGGIAGRNPALPILKNVLIKIEGGKLKLSATDLEVGITTWIAGKADGEGATTIPLKQLAEYVQNLPNEHVNLVINGDSLTITCGSAHASFQGESAENFPLIPAVKDGKKITLPTISVFSALDRVIYATAIDDSRPELSGILWEGHDKNLIVAATDSYRLAEHQITLNEPTTDFRIIIPLRAAHEVKRALEGEEQINIIVSDGQIQLETVSTHLVSRLIEGNYPDYKPVIPAMSTTTASVLRYDLLRSLKGASVFSYGEVNSILLETTAQGVKVNATAQEIGETASEIPAEVKGDNVSISFNPRYLIDAITSLPGERVRLGFTNASVSCVIRPEDPNEKTLGLVMPIKT